MRFVLAMIVVAGCSFSARLDNAPSEAGPGGEAGMEAGTEAGMEAGMTCPANTTCDDMNACTDYDACFGDACTGVDTLCANECATTCLACGADTCCRETCPAGMCQTCPSNCDCTQSCGSTRPCSATCSAGARCKVTGTNNGDPDGDYNVVCQAGSFCVADCVGDDGDCNVTCEAGAACMLIDNMGGDGSPMMSCAGGTVVTCPSPNQNVRVCNRPCP